MTARALPPVPVMDRRGYELQADMVGVLASPKTLMIVDLLSQGPATVTEIAGRLTFSLQNASQLLRQMRDRSIVRAERDGREVRYTLASPVIAEACRLFREAILTEARARPAHLGWGGGVGADVEGLLERKPMRRHARG